MDAARGGDVVGVDEVDGGGGADVVDQSGGGIDIEAGADDDEDVGLHGLACGQLDVGHGLAEEDDVGSEQRAVAGQGARLDLAVVGRQGALVAGVLGVAAGADLHQLAVQVDDVRGAGLLVQVVDVLGDHHHLIFLLQSGHQPVALVGLDAPALAAQHVIEVGHQRRVGLPSLVRGHLCHGVFLPQSVGVAEGSESALDRHACACQYNYFLHIDNCKNY